MKKGYVRAAPMSGAVFSSASSSGFLGQGLVVAAISTAVLLAGCGGGGDTSKNTVVNNTNVTTSAAKTFVGMDDSGDTTITPPERLACVQDQTTKLYWEVKSDEGAGAQPDFRDKDYGYNWYDGQNGYQGLPAGDASTASILGSYPCQKSGTNLVRCDTGSYVRAVNAAGLCGFKDWRLPKVSELLGLVDTSRTSAPYIYSALGSTSWDPEQLGNPVRGYWTSDPAASGYWQAVSFSLKDGNRAQGHSNSYNYIRLVRP
ncbi:DUF1566 domain-containing protein [Candidatus Thiothrix sp. Deng01]|uniref:DUF1566 domain-containing protein n=1 Tax=Candidatus Thiothrix phosphatis TaxID=3112415 RepID=A0ABU6CU82_9GAMM|nr:DUF1566 domain-containing protein [Candidatus Thiothrix sp. Deng01]MEB4590386.1 DUF1566 domain-containing protein [Candidatus Thiothrix sp. Deng01]